MKNTFLSAYLTASQESLHHAASLGNTQLDHTQETIRHVLVAHVSHSLHGFLQKLVERGVLKHQLQLVALLLVGHLLGGGPHAGHAVADLSKCGRVPSGEVQHVRRGAAALEVVVERRPPRCPL